MSKQFFLSITVKVIKLKVLIRAYSQLHMN